MKPLFKFSRLSLALLLLASACASRPDLERYSRTEIDRPYTLPNGVSNWHIPVIYGNVKDNFSSSTLGPVPVPLLWESSLSDDWNLIWLPLPLAVTHQLSKTADARIGLSFGTSFSYSSLSGFRLMPNLGFSYRKYFSETFALDFNPFYTPDIPFQSGESFRYRAGFTTGPLFQVSELVSIKPILSINYIKGQLVLNGFDSPDPKLVEQDDLIYGAGFDGVLSMGRQWDLRPSYRFSGWGSRDGLRAHLATLDFVHFW